MGCTFWGAYYPIKHHQHLCLYAVPFSKPFMYVGKHYGQMMVGRYHAKIPQFSQTGKNSGIFVVRNKPSATPIPFKAKTTTDVAFFLVKIIHSKQAGAGYQRNLRVTKVSTANSMPTIQKRVTIFASCIPNFW